MAAQKKSTTAVSIIQNRVDAMVAGFQKDLTAKQSLQVEGGSMPQPQILTKLNGIDTLLANVTATKNAFVAAVEAKKAGMPDARAFLASLEQALKVQFGSRSPLLQDFGMKLPKARTKPDAETVALAKAKRRDTRQARGTKGAVQASKITVQGQPGLALVTPGGEIVPGLLRGPTPPGSGTPVAPPAAGGSSNSGSAQSPAAQVGEAPPAGSPPGK